MGIGTSLKKLIGGIAPVIGSALGGPMGGVAMKFLADKFTGGDTGKVEDFLLSASPETLQELKLAEIEFDKHMADLGVRLEELDVQDRSSAREMASARGIYVQAGISCFYTLGYFAVFFAFVFGYAKVPPAYNDMVVALIGALGAAQLQILNFWFGSSRSSKDKTEILMNGKH